MTFLLGVQAFAPESRAEYPLSDHYDGKRFFNPGAPAENNFGKFLKWQIGRQLSHSRRKWPSTVAITPSRPAQRLFPGETPRATFINHSSYLIQLPGVNLLTDPIFSGRAGGSLGARRVHEPGIRPDALPPIDIVLISHDHLDHLDLASLDELKAYSPLFVVPLGVARHLEKKGIRRVIELDWWQQYSIVEPGALEITLTPARHYSGRGLMDRDRTLWGSFVVKDPVSDRQICFIGDSGYASHFQEISSRFGPMDLSLIPIGAYRPASVMKSVHMSPEEAVQVHLDLRSKLSLGVHYATFPLTDEGRDEPALDLKHSLVERGLSADEFLAPEPGTVTQF